MAEEVVADLDATTRAKLEEHFASCASCAGLYREVLAFDAGLTAATDEVAAPLTMGRGLGLRIGAGPKWVLGATSLLGCTAAGYFYGEAGTPPPMIQAVPAANAHADIIRFQNYEVVQRQAPGLENGALYAWNFEQGRVGQWDIPRNLPTENLVQLDSEFARTGSRSLKFSHVRGGGRAHLDLMLPIPKGTHIVVAAWVLSPRGRVPDGKWLSFGAQLFAAEEREGDQSASVDVIAPTRDWQMIPLNLNAERDAKGLRIEIHTTAGDEALAPEEWSSWVDDIQVAIKLVAPESKLTLKGDRVIVDFPMPAGYAPSSIVQDSMTLLDNNFGRFTPVGVETLTAKNNWVRMVFRSKGAVDKLDGMNPTTRVTPLDGLVRGRIKHGSLSLPFEIGIRRTQ